MMTQQQSDSVHVQSGVPEMRHPALWRCGTVALWHYENFDNLKFEIFATM